MGKSMETPNDEKTNDGGSLLSELTGLVSRLPHTADGTPIIPGDTVYILDPDASWPESVAQVVQSIHLGLGFDEYKGTHTICGDELEAGNLECWSSLEAFKEGNPWANG